MSKKKLPPLPPSDDPVLLAIKEAHKRPLATFTSTGPKRCVSRSTTRYANSCGPKV